MVADSSEETHEVYTRRHVYPSREYQKKKRAEYGATLIIISSGKTRLSQASHQPVSSELLWHSFLTLMTTYLSTVCAAQLPCRWTRGCIGSTVPHPALEATCLAKVYLFPCSPCPFLSPSLIFSNILHVSFGVNIFFLSSFAPKQYGGLRVPGLLLFQGHRKHWHSGRHAMVSPVVLSVILSVRNVGHSSPSQRGAPCPGRRNCCAVG